MVLFQPLQDTNMGKPECTATFEHQSNPLSLAYSRLL